MDRAPATITATDLTGKEDEEKTEEEENKKKKKKEEEESEVQKENEKQREIETESKERENEEKESIVVTATAVAVRTAGDCALHYTSESSVPTNHICRDSLVSTPLDAAFYSPILHPRHLHHTPFSLTPSKSSIVSYCIVLYRILSYCRQPTLC
jgi:hypothetical protein